MALRVSPKPIRMARPMRRGTPWSLAWRVWLANSRYALPQDVDLDARNIMDAIESGVTDQWAILYDQFIKHQKGDNPWRANVWDAYDALWVIGAQDAQAGYLQLKDPANADPLLPINSPNFLADRGIMGNGATSYVNTQWNPSVNGDKYTLNACHLGIVRLTGDDGVANTIDIGASAGTSNRVAIFTTSTLSPLAMIARLNQNSAGAHRNVGTGAGHKIVNRTASDFLQYFQQGERLDPQNPASTAIPNLELFLGCNNNNGSPATFAPARRYFAAHVGGPLTDEQAKASTQGLAMLAKAVGAI